MSFKSKRIFILLLLLYLTPVSVFAYSKEIIAGGENIGIKLNTKGIMIVGTYSINGEYPSEKAGLKIGDSIVEINGENVSNIDDLASKMNDVTSDEVSIKYIRNSEEKTTKLKLYKDESNVYKTGLFVKDSIIGIGTLTFIDPSTKKFGALGHEILEQSTGKILEIKDGKIFESNVTGIIRSDNGNPGEKKAEFNEKNSLGIAKENTTQGIFGDYTGSLDSKKAYKVMNSKDVKTEEAKILTVLDNKEIKQYNIIITQIISTSSKNKNFIFEITDEELLNKTGGIIQGMSGSPIIKDNYIIGAITHVVVNEPNKGYGIFIENMLEEAEN